MTGQPLVTVIALCYNHAHFVIECLDSIRNQTYRNVQIIITDDCSQDDSVEIIRVWIARYGIECKFIVHKKNQGVCLTLNDALIHATGKYVAMVACDDGWVPERIAAQIAVMEGLPETVGVLYSDATVIDESGVVLEGSFLARHCKFPDGPPSGDIFEKLIPANFIPAMSTLVRRSCYDVVGRYDDRLVYEDWDMWLRISARFDFYYLPALVARYRLVSTSMMRTIVVASDPRLHFSSYLIFEKMLTLRLGNTVAAQTGISGMCGSAERLYKLGHPAAPPMLRRVAATRGGRWHTRQLALCATLGVSWPVCQRLQSQYASIKSYLKWRFVKRDKP